MYGKIYAAHRERVQEYIYLIKTSSSYK